ncbi:MULTISPECIES: hypothetical protein [Comamonas]|uniref:Uncharacterized protein n=1 Tax=Comamonas sediminis TaxID=1783360 RepID=A0ABV4B7H5_9BURK|nr:hypothetical protein [Comamonas sp. B21-038]ULR87579.1 hypothetical protein MJ205_14050 [Comamonas sp. B21-038]
MQVVKHSLSIRIGNIEVKKSGFHPGELGIAKRLFAASDFCDAPFLIAAKNQIWSDQAVGVSTMQNTFSFNFMQDLSVKDPDSGNCVPITLLVL